MWLQRWKISAGIQNFWESHVMESWQTDTCKFQVFSWYPLLLWNYSCILHMSESEEDLELLRTVGLGWVCLWRKLMEFQLLFLCSLTKLKHLCALNFSVVIWLMLARGMRGEREGKLQMVKLCKDRSDQPKQFALALNFKRARKNRIGSIVCHGWTKPPEDCTKLKCWYFFLFRNRFRWHRSNRARPSWHVRLGR